MICATFAAHFVVLLLYQQVPGFKDPNLRVAARANLCIFRFLAMTVHFDLDGVVVGGPKGATRAETAKETDSLAN